MSHYQEFIENRKPPVNNQKPPVWKLPELIQLHDGTIVTGEVLSKAIIDITKEYYPKTYFGVTKELK